MDSQDVQNRKLKPEKHPWASIGSLTKQYLLSGPKTKGFQSAFLSTPLREETSAETRLQPQRALSRFPAAGSGDSHSFSDCATAKRHIRPCAHCTGAGTCDHKDGPPLGDLGPQQSLKNHFIVPSHELGKTVSSRLCKELRRKYNLRSVPVLKDDEVQDSVINYCLGQTFIKQVNMKGGLRALRRSADHKVVQVYGNQYVSHIKQVQHEEAKGTTVYMDIHPGCLSPGWNQTETGNKFFNAKPRLVKLGKRKANVGSSGGRRSEMSCHAARANCRGLLLWGVFETFRACLMYFIVYFIVHLLSTDLSLCQSPSVVLIIYE
ncbi:hypothetical protein ACRRTK_006529 [Alexandromys fortis]